MARPARPSIEWKDLARLSRLETARELTLSLPWLLASWAFSSRGLYALALACSFMFFLTGLRQVHNAYHYALGIPRRATEWVMAAMSVAMLGSMHAIQLNHLRHHRHCMDVEDVEAISARMPAWKAIAFGPVFPVLLHRKALQAANTRQRRWILGELAANAGLVAATIAVDGAPWLRYHVAAMAAGQCLTAFFAVWTVHHDCEPEGVFARTIRHRFKALATYNMFFHVEHHLFPAVPTCKLPRLAERLDAAAPEWGSRRVF